VRGRDQTLRSFNEAPGYRRTLRYIRLVPDCARRRIFIVTNEILGVVRTGGSGTANTFLALALAREGHAVELLVTAPNGPIALDPAWAERYGSRGVGVRLLDPPARDVAPGALALAVTVQEALEADPPDVAIVDCWAGSGYLAQRLRALDLALQQTTFVVVCSGSTAWNYETDRKLPRSFPAFELEALERASVELADAVVSPSRFLKEWLEARGWALPPTHVAPYFTQASVDGDPGKAVLAPRIERIAFFGRLEERKGVAPFIAALDRLEPERLSGVELAFVGRETPQWPTARIQAALSDAVKDAVSRVRFETGLDQPEGIALLKEPGTLAVMPSLLDNSPNVVYECLEHGIPFLAGRVGGVPELVAPDDRDRALVTPTAQGIAQGLERVLASPEELRPVRPGFDRAASLAAWRDALATQPAVGAPQVEETRTVGVAVKGDDHDSIDVTGSEFVLLVDERDDLDASCLETLLHAQAASDADAVTCAVLSNGKRTYFLGEPHELGLVGNYYGLVGLYRRSVLEEIQPERTDGDTDWVRLATLAQAGKRIVSVPRPLARTTRTPGTPLNEPFGAGAALAVARVFEQACPPELRELPRLAASLAGRRMGSSSPASLPARLRWIWEHEGAAGVARRSVESARSRLRAGAKLDDGRSTPRGAVGDT
jgi:glycosyltransferase involved in cell wall biosynthesis